MSESNISSVQSIDSTVKKYTNEFSFIDILANFVGNSRFKAGYVKLKQGNNDEDTYIWETLSAIGADIGETIYSNVLNYIDNASNIDLCKMTALRSMLQAYGVNNSFLNIIDDVPLEIRNILDVMSINKKYLLDVGIVNDSLRNDIISSVCDKIYSKDELVKMHYASFNNKYQILNKYSDSSINGEYLPISLYSNDSFDSHIDTHLSINVCKKFTREDAYVEKRYDLPYQDENGEDIKTLYTIVTSKDEILKFNLLTDDYFVDEHFHGLMRNSTYEYKLSTGEGTYSVVEEHNGLIGLMYNVEKIIDYTVEDSRRIGSIFSNLLTENLFKHFANDGQFATYQDVLDDKQTYDELEKVDYVELTDQTKILAYALIAKLHQYENQYQLSALVDVIVNMNDKKSKQEYATEITSFIQKCKAEIGKVIFAVSSISAITWHDEVNRNLSNETSELKYLQDKYFFYQNIKLEDEKYYSYLSSMYFNMLSGVCSMHYVTNSDQYSKPIYCYLSNDLLVNVKKDNLSSESKFIKLKNGVDLSFDEQKIADDIDKGLDSIDNYDGICYDLIEAEQKRRHSTLDKTVGELTTRTSFYREQKVKEYFKFVEEKFYGSHEYMLSNAYILDNSYIEVDLARSNYIKLLDKQTMQLKEDVLKYVANDLTKLTMYIQRLRESMKIQAQKYYMKGTFNLLSYVVNEYLIEFSRLDTQLNDQSLYTTEELDVVNTVKRKLSAHAFDDISIVEYNDNTEYFNLLTENTEKAKNKEYANKQYWNGSNSCFSAKFSIAAQQIQDFYLEKLKCKDKISNIDNFLSVLYSIGADDSYVDDKTNAIEAHNDSELSSQYFMNFLKWNGRKFGYQPYYNHKNLTHSSYQVHPCLYDFVEVADMAYSIKNAFENGIAYDVIEQKVIDDMKTNIGKYGQVIDLWKNNAYDFSGYKTNYEKNSYVVNSTTYSEVCNYDGAFYPPAVEAYINDRENFIKSIQSRESTVDKTSYYERFYKHLNLSDADLDYLVNQLSCNDTISYSDYYQQIKDIVENKLEKKDVYDIYKYGTDRYDNIYVLYKQYPDATQSYTEKENVCGSLWIRRKDHPIAFPAFTGKYPAIDINATDSNGKITYLVKEGGIQTDSIDRLVIADSMQYFYDFEFDSPKRTIVLNSYPINNPNYAKQMRQHKVFYNKAEHADILICNINANEDVVTRRTTLSLTEDQVLRYDTLANNNILGKHVSNDLSALQAFIGYYKDSNSIVGVYVDKYFNSDGLSRGINNDFEKLTTGIEFLDAKRLNITMSYYTWHLATQTSQHTHTIDIRQYLKEHFNITGSAVRMNYSGNMLTFAVLAEIDSAKACTNYVGKNTNTNSMMEYPTETSGFVIELAALSDINSFDAFEQYVTTIDTKLIGNSLELVGVDMFNLNSDASYIPQYAGEKGKNELWMTNKYKDEQYHAIELLGWSRNIDKYISATTAASDISYDMSNFESFILGRVYENYDADTTALLKTTYSPAIYSNNSRTDIGNAFKWEIDLTDYTDNELNGLELLMFNNKCNGRNPYYNGKLADIVAATATEKYIVAKNYIDHDGNEEQQISADVADIFVAGTFNFFSSPVNIYDTNHIDNISKIEFRYVANSGSTVQTRRRKLQVLFYKIDRNKISYIESETISITFYNKFNLRMYEYYHFLNERSLTRNEHSLTEYQTDTTLSNDPYQWSYVMLSDLHNDNYLPYFLSVGSQEYNELSAKLSSILQPDGQKMYLKDMSIVDKNYLSDIFVFRGYDNISFKYSDEEVYNIPDFRYYYPGHNMQYPTLDASLFELSALEYSFDEVFQQKNLFIYQTEDSKAFANKIGTVEIPVEYNETNCLRVYEDYNSAYGAENPDILSCAHITTTDSATYYKTVTIDGKQYLDVDDIHSTQSIEATLNALKKRGYSQINTESLSSDYEFQTVRFNVNSNNTDLSNLLDIYVNYKVEYDGTITLYFNYYNFLNTPFIKFGENGLPTPTSFDRTYLMLKSGQDGLLDVDVQFKAYYGKSLYGIQTGTLLTYKIFNVSDDKPKFVFYKMSEIQKNSLCQDAIEGDTSIAIKNTYVDLDDDAISKVDCIPFVMQLKIDSIETIAKGMKFSVYYYLPEMTVASVNCPGFDYVVDEDPEQSSIGSVSFTSNTTMNIKSIFISYVTTQNKGHIVDNKINSYEIDVANAFAKSTDGNDLDVQIVKGSVLFGYEVLLRVETEKEVPLISAEPYTFNGKVTNFIIKDRN